MDSWTSCSLVVLLVILQTRVPLSYGRSSSPLYGTGRGPGQLGSGVVRSLPEHLVACYSDPELLRRETRMPLTMANLVDLLQRVERDPSFVADLRMTVTTVLHRFRVDGLERNPLVAASPGVTPYRLTGLQYPRYRVLMGRLLSGNANLFPNASLTMKQQCALHWMLSSAVDPWERGDELWICPKVPTPRSHVPALPPGRLGVSVYGGHRLYPDPVRDGSLWGGSYPVPPPFDSSPPAWSACPVEEGVVEAGRFGGDVSVGTVLAGLAAGLQPQTVPLASLLSPRHLQRLRADGGRDADTVDNLWAATLAGDLAEVSAYQGPSANGVLALGPAGEWNSSLIPRVRYLSRNRPGSPELAPVQHWDMTDAELRGGFDGLALGARIASWTQLTGLLRLSQILDMYYSPRGMAFEPDVKACNRAAASASYFTPDVLYNQTSRFARTLTDASPAAPYMTEDALRNFTGASVRAFLRYADDLLSADVCDSPTLTDVRVNVLVVLDTTWERGPAYEFITTLASSEGVDVGLFGSRISVMNGGVGGPTGGHWIVNFTDSPVQLAMDWITIDAADDNWPTFLDLPWTLMAVMEHLMSKSEAESARGSGGSSHGDVVVILATGSTISDTDMRHAKTLIVKIKEIDPDIRLLYVVTEVGEKRFQELTSMNVEWDDAVIVVDDVEPASMAQAVTNYLREMPGRLIPAECTLVRGGTHSNRSRVKTWPVQHGAHVLAAPGVRRGRGMDGAAGGISWGLKGVLEDTVSPGKLRLYRINTAYTSPGVPVGVQLVGEDYGALRMCMWRGAAPGGPVAAMKAALRAEDDGGGGSLDPDDPLEPQAVCVNMEGSGEANVTIQEPCINECAPLYVSVYASVSTFKCTDMDCRYPDDVRYLLRPFGIYCADAETSTSASNRHSAQPAYFWTAVALPILLLVAMR